MVIAEGIHLRNVHHFIHERVREGTLSPRWTKEEHGENLASDWLAVPNVFKEGGLVNRQMTPRDQGGIIAY